LSMDTSDLLWGLFVFVILPILSAVGGYLLLRPNIIVQLPDISQGTVWTMEIMIRNNGKLSTNMILCFIRYFKEGKLCSSYEQIHVRQIQAIAGGEERKAQFSFYENFYEYDIMEIVLLYDSYPLGIWYKKSTKYNICHQGNIRGLVLYKKSKTNIIFRPNKIAEKYRQEYDKNG